MVRGNWFSIIKIDKEKVEKTIKFIESGTNTIAGGQLSRIVEAVGQEIWLGKKMPISFRTEQMRYKNKYVKEMSVEEANFYSNFVVAGSKLLTLYKVPNNIKSFLSTKKVTIKRRGRRDRTQIVERFGDANRDFQILYLAGYNKKTGPKYSFYRPYRTNKVIIRTRLFNIIIKSCEINEFIILSKGLKTFLPSLEAFLLRFDNKYGPERLDKTDNVTDLSAEDIVSMFLFSSDDGPNPFNRKDDKDDNGDVVAS
tara:strand:+ start:389 stop:1150 length:762 start_codon:yes stop_codon:yes gene_type:complete